MSYRLDGVADLLDLYTDLKEIVEMKEAIKKVTQPEIQATSSGAPFKSKNFNGEVITTSIRAYSEVIKRFRSFASELRGVKNQDLISQALSEFIENHEMNLVRPLTIEVGSSVNEMIDKELFYEKLMKLKKDIERDNDIYIPPIQIKSNLELDSMDYIISIGEGEYFNGRINYSLSVLENQFLRVIKQKFI